MKPSGGPELRKGEQFFMTMMEETLHGTTEAQVIKLACTERWEKAFLS